MYMCKVRRLETDLNFKWHGAGRFFCVFPRFSFKAKFYATKKKRRNWWRENKRKWKQRKRNEGEEKQESWDNVVNAQGMTRLTTLTAMDVACPDRSSRERGRHWPSRLGRNIHRGNPARLSRLPSFIGRLRHLLRTLSLFVAFLIQYVNPSQLPTQSATTFLLALLPLCLHPQVFPAGNAFTAVSDWLLCSAQFTRNQSLEIKCQFGCFYLESSGGQAVRQSRFFDLRKVG